MNIAFYIITYNRPNILAQSIRTAINNTSVKPNEIWIIDDGSTPDLKSALLNYSIENSSKIPVNLLIHGVNLGIGYSFERVYSLINQNEDLDIACIIESDYIWRKDWLKDVLDIFESQQNCIAIAGADHPDMHDRSKTHRIFPEIMKDFFGEDLKSREYLYKPFFIDTNSGKIEVQGVSNSCGCSILNWKRLKRAINYLETNGKVPINDFWKRMDKGFHKNVPNNTRKQASDGWMSTTISKYGEMYLESIGIDITKNFPFLSICDYSISEHICGGGVNGYVAPEGATFIRSPKWNNQYLDKNPRN